MLCVSAWHSTARMFYALKTGVLGQHGLGLERRIRDPKVPGRTAFES